MGKERSMVVGVVWNCAELKFVLTGLLLLGSFFTLLQFLPPRATTISPTEFRSCLSRIFQNQSSSSPSPSLATQKLSSSSPSLATQKLSLPAPPPPPPPPPPLELEEASTAGPVLKQIFRPYGAAAYLFIQMSSYRGGLNTFAVTGLASKPLHVFGKPTFQCIWIPSASGNKTLNASSSSITVNATKFLPDWGYGRVYTVVVLNCTFPTNVGDDRSGGRLLLRAFHGSHEDRQPEEFVALTERPGSLNASVFTSPPSLDYVYCGSPLYGDLSPQRVREWLAYHVKLFGPRSRIIIYNAGGVHPDVFRVLEPWIEAGYVTVHDITEQEKFDGYYHNQFLVVNDCLHRYRFMSRWIFFFDVDEYIYVPPGNTLPSLLSSLSNYTQFTIEQMPMSNKLCLLQDYRRAPREWGIEKLVFRNVKRGIRRDRKYAIQARNAFATGVHMSENVVGKAQHKTEGRIKYFHYHGTISTRREPCRKFVNASELIFESSPFVLDTTMRALAPSIKKFELKTIGERLRSTRQ
ncbi:galactan beta-1,4-galactosyltransferase GALS3 [Amborella trichopoda]|nr:galactan beta-1,4-galactosyltransferase GALS3 [Amborella trichopoda]|eukprot:XP_006855865.2 galactan beta-1,4-galactosyltransferase GALS3 [Amborella trichopoda]